MPLQSRTKRLSSATIVTILLCSALLSLVPTTFADESSQPTGAGAPIFMLGERTDPGIGARALCTIPQNDAGSGADAGNDHTVSTALGSDPTQQNITGCIDASDTADWYDVQISADKDVSVELTVPTGADFDLYIKDSTNTTFIDVSEYDDPLENVFFFTNATSGGTYYIWVNLWTGDGDYSLDIWTNASTPKPDLTVSGISGPASANLSDVVTVSFTVNNIGTVALTSSTPYDVPIILSTDAVYDTADTILNIQISGPNLAAGASQMMSPQITIPSTLAVGNYYWLVWPDGWGNVTEEDELNNFGSSMVTMSVSSGGTSTSQNDGGSGADFPNNATNTTNYIFGNPDGSLVLTGEIGGTDTDDWLTVNHNSNQGVAASLSFATGNDFDLYMYDNTSINQVSSSAGFSNPENVSTNGTTYSGTLVYLHISAWLSSGNWTLSIWKFTTSSGNGTGGTNLSADYLEPNDVSSNASPVILPYTDNGLTIHDSTDEDIFNFTVVTGETYWVNITFLDVDGDLDLELHNSAAMTLEDGSYSATDDESVSATIGAASSSIFYVRVYGFGGATNTYGITIETTAGGGGNTTPPTPASGLLDATFIDADSGEFNATNLTSGADYSIHVFLTYWNGSAHTFLGELWDNWTQSSGDRNFPVTLTLTSGGIFCLFGDLYDMNFTSAGALIATDMDCLDYILTETVVISDTSADVLLTNLTAGTYTLDWYLYDGYGPTYSDSGSQPVTIGSGGTASIPIGWAAPSQGLKCFYAVLYDVNMTYVDEDYECFTPTYPELVITAMDNTSVDFDIYNLTAGNDYENQVTIYEDLSGTLFAQSALTSFTAFGTNSTGWSWNFAAPTTDGYYCAYVDLYDSTSTLLVTDVLCIWLEFDDDGDGVMNLDDMCPNTPPGSPVNADGCAPSETDTDGDGYMDDVDEFPVDPTQWIDSDGDGFGDNASGTYGDAFPTDPTEWHDADGDGYGDNYADAFPLDPTQWSDADGDGCGDNLNGTNPDDFPFDPSECTDSDGDGVGDNADPFPNDSTQWSDVDGDGCGDNLNGTNPDEFPNDPNECTDSDGDGVGDNADPFPNDSTQWSDMDGDGYGDNAAGNNPDAFPNDSTEWVDTDGDGCGDNGDAFPNDASECIDSDGDGYGDNEDAFPNDASEWVDTDGDAVGDNADDFPFDSTQTTDSDGDGYGDNPLGNDADALPNDSTQWADRDGDGYGDNQQGNSPDAFPDDGSQWNDRDQDGFGDNMAGTDPDHCPDTPMGETVDSQGCALSELDSDADGVMDDKDACGDTPLNEQADVFGCSPSQLDTDFDTVSDDRDACPDTPLGAEVDLAGCAQSQLDDDSDGVMNDADMCYGTPFNEQADEFGCSAGQRDTDGDGVHDDVDQCPETLMPPAQGMQIDDAGCAEDVAPPVLNLVGPAEVTLEFDAVYEEEGATCVDNMDGELDSLISITSTVVSGAVGDYEITYECIDSSGHSAQVSRQVHVVDTEPPVVMLNGPDNVTLEAGSIYLDPGASCYDGLDGDISHTVSVTGLDDLDIETAGQYTIVYDCQDAAGNGAQGATRVVEFTEAERQVNSGGGFAAGAGLSTSSMNMIAGIVAVLVLAGGAALLFLRKGDDVEQIKSVAEHMLVQAQQEAGQWRDESGMHWNRQDDGTLLWWDEGSSEWKRYD